ncbi:MAG: hypothetical protein Q9161_000515 [Pseudevernia consocians]
MDRKNTLHLSAEQIPVRSSSRSPEKSDASGLKRIREWETERSSCTEEAKRQRKRLKTTSSFDAGYWTRRRDIAEMDLRATLLTKKISIASFKNRTDDSTRDFVNSEEGRRLMLQEESLRLDRKLFKAQAERMGSKEPEFNLRRSFTQLFVGAETGLGIKNSRGQRDNSLQSAFRSELILKTGSEHPVMDDQLWCPILRNYLPDISVIAGHLFPCKCGEATMQAIFGRSDSGHSELFRAENGILWSQQAEDRFEAGHFVVVPDVPDQSTEQQLDTWEASDPKEYKIRVLNPTDTSMKKTIWGRDITWAALDNERLQFKTSFRPRARFLYFAYCTAMLRRSFGGKHLEVSRGELRKRFWGTPGRYMFEGMLLGFVEEMGHDYQHLLDGAIKEDEAVVDATGVVVANQCIQDKLKVDDDEEPDSDDDDDDDKDDNKGDAERPGCAHMTLDGC